MSAQLLYIKEWVCVELCPNPLFAWPFEPNPMFSDRLRKNCRANDINVKNVKEITARRKAVAGELSSRQIRMDTIQLLGLAAGSLTTVSFVPEVSMAWKARSAKYRSLGMFSLFFLGVVLWLVYGIIERDVPVVVANLLTFLLAATLLFFKLRFKA